MQGTRLSVRLASYIFSQILTLNRIIPVQHKKYHGCLCPGPLCWHVQNFVAIRLPMIELQLNEISIEFEL